MLFYNLNEQKITKSSADVYNLYLWWWNNGSCAIYSKDNKNTIIFLLCTDTTSVYLWRSWCHQMPTFMD